MIDATHSTALDLCTAATLLTLRGLVARLAERPAERPPAPPPGGDQPPHFVYEHLGMAVVA